MRTHFIWRGRTPLRAAYSGHGGVAPGAKPPDSASFSPSTALPRHEERRPSPSMRLFWLILLIACVLMAGGRCYGCGETFKRLGRHLDKCDKEMLLITLQALKDEYTLQKSMTLLPAIVTQEVDLMMQAMKSGPPYVHHTCRDASAL